MNGRSPAGTDEVIFSDVTVAEGRWGCGLGRGGDDYKKNGIRFQNENRSPIFLDYSLRKSFFDLGVKIAYYPTIITQKGREELSIILENYCSLKKYQCKANKWIGFGIDILNTDFLVSDFFLDQSKWERDPKLDNALKWAIKQKMIGLSPNFKRID
jgi:hypothetical protein